MSKYMQIKKEIDFLKEEFNEERQVNPNSRKCQEIEEKISYLEDDLKKEKEEEELTDRENREILEMFRLTREQSEVKKEKRKRCNNELETAVKNKNFSH